MLNSHLVFRGAMLLLVPLLGEGLPKPAASSQVRYKGPLGGGLPKPAARWVSSHSGLTSTVGTQLTASAPHVSSWALSANTHQDTISMRREGLPVTPIIVQRHVGSLAKVCPVHLDYLSGAANLSPRPACSSEDALNWS